MSLGVSSIETACSESVRVPTSHPSGFSNVSPKAPSPRARIAELYTSYGAMVFARCRFLLRDEEAARDATQDVFIKAFRAWDKFRGDASPHTWINKIATNHCLNLIAADKAAWKDRFRRYVHHLDDSGMLAGVDPDRARLVRQLLAKVSPEVQAAAIYYYVDEMTQEEIAELLGRSLPTIRKRLRTFQRVAQKELSREPS